MTESGWVAVGRLRRTRGIRGEMVAEIYSTQPGRAEKLKNVMLELEGRKRPAEVEHYWSHDGRPVFKFVGMDSISESEVWQGADILVAEGERAEPAEGEYSHADLIGCSVVPVGQAAIGIVTGVEDYGGPPLLKVKRVAGQEILIPFANAICREIDVDAKVIRVELPEGLLELP